MTTKELKALNKRFKEIKIEMKELKDDYKNGTELDGEKMLENEYHEALSELVDELEEIKAKYEGVK